MFDVVFVDPPYGTVDGVEIYNVLAGYPAANEGFEHGDVIVKVDGSRVHNIADFKKAITQSSGTVTLRVRDVRTGSYINYPNIKLVKVSQGGGSGGTGGGPDGP